MNKKNANYLYGVFAYLSVSQKIQHDLHVLEHVEPQAASLAGLQ